jgi:hypothetical protein
MFDVTNCIYYKTIITSCSLRKHNQHYTLQILGSIKELQVLNFKQQNYSPMTLTEQEVTASPNWFRAWQV